MISTYTHSRQLGIHKLSLEELKLYLHSGDAKIQLAKAQSALHLFLQHTEREKLQAALRIPENVVAVAALSFPGQLRGIFEDIFIRQHAGFVNPAQAFEIAETRHTSVV